MQSKTNVDMQCLRAIAVIMVVMQHYKVRLPTTQGYIDMFNSLSLWTGVDIFFAISGFLIYRSIASEISRYESRTEAAKSFFEKRVRRLVPALLVGLTLSIAASAVATNTASHDPLKTLISAITAVIGVSNFYWSACVMKVIDGCGNPDFNGVTWSLSLEWQLYAIAFLLISVAGGRKGFIIALVLACLVSVWPAPSFSLLWVTRPMAFVLGWGLGTLSFRRSIALPRIVSLALLAAGLSICITAPVHAPTNLSLALIGMGGGMCLLACASDSLFSRRSVLTIMLSWIGDRSYSIYLIHLPLILLVREGLMRTGAFEDDAIGIILGMAFSLPLIALAADQSFRRVEQRFRKTRDNSRAASIIS